MKLKTVVESILMEGTKPKFVYHGGDINNLQSLLKNFRILTPTEKLKFPSTGGGYIGLSTSTDKNKAKRYSRVFGNDSVLLIRVSPNARFKYIDSSNGSIDEVLTQDEIEEFGLNGYDAIIETTSDFESEVRVLSNTNFKPIRIEK